MLVCTVGGIVIPLLRLRWTVPTCSDCAASATPDRTHGGVLSLLAVPAAGVYLVWFSCEMAHWLHQ
jgi:hypothetical protein